MGYAIVDIWNSRLEQEKLIKCAKKPSQLHQKRIVLTEIWIAQKSIQKLVFKDSSIKTGDHSAVTCLER